MTTFAASKVLSSLPGTLAADTMYCVRVGTGFDLYITDTTAAIAYKINGATGVPIRTTQTAAYTFVAADIGACTPFDFTAAADATIPSGLTSTIGAVLYIAQDGSAAVTFVAGSGVVVNPTGKATAHTGDWCCAIYRGNDGTNDQWDAL